MNRATATAAEITNDELQAGLPPLVDKIVWYGPRIVAFLGLSAYRTAFHAPQVPVGPQDEPLAGAKVWLLPNPSGLNAHYRVADLIRLYGALRTAVDTAPGSHLGGTSAAVGHPNRHWRPPGGVACSEGGDLADG